MTSRLILATAKVKQVSLLPIVTKIAKRAYSRPITTTIMRSSYRLALGVRLSQQHNSKTQFSSMGCSVQRNYARLLLQKLNRMVAKLQRLKLTKFSLRRGKNTLILITSQLMPRPESCTPTPPMWTSMSNLVSVMFFATFKLSLLSVVSSVSTNTMLYHSPWPMSTFQSSSKTRSTTATPITTSVSLPNWKTKFCCPN